MSKLNVALVSLATIAGCSQVLGLGDYDIDPALDDGKGGSSIGVGGAQGDAGSDSTPSSGAGGDGNLPMGGQAGQGGEPQGPGGAGGEPAREVIPCDSVECCTTKGGTAVGVELLTDGGFELGPIADGDSPWVQESTFDLETVTLTDATGEDFESHAGQYFAYLSGAQGERSSIYSPDLEIPNDAGWFTLSGWRLFQVDVQDSVNEDFCLIALWGPGVEDPQELPYWWGNPEQYPDGWADTPIWRKFETSFDAAPHQGTTRYIGFRGESDLYPVEPDPADPAVTYSSSFLFDDVSLKVFTCVK